MTMDELKNEPIDLEREMIGAFFSMKDDPELNFMVSSDGKHIIIPSRQGVRTIIGEGFDEMTDEELEERIEKFHEETEGEWR